MNYQQFIDKSNEIEQRIISMVYNDYFKKQKSIAKPRPMSWVLPSQQCNTRIIKEKTLPKSRMGKSNILVIQAPSLTYLVDEKLLKRYNSRISKYPNCKVPAELNKMMDNSLRFRQLSNVQDSKIQKYINQNKSNLHVSDSCSAMNSKILDKMSNKGANASPISKEKMILNINKIFRLDSPNHKMNSIDYGYDKKTPLTTKLFMDSSKEFIKSGIIGRR